MPTTEPKAIRPKQKRQKAETQEPCYHCGDPCLTTNIRIDEKAFCCEGCKMVYEIITSNELCDYYALQQHPGLSSIKSVRSDKFAFLDEEKIAESLLSFTDGEHAIVSFYLPGVHCSSCMWLLEHLRRINKGITESRLNFGAKVVTIHFQQSLISLREVVELLSTIGYEPSLNLDSAVGKKPLKSGRTRIYRLGIAGFSFSFIMMMSFPEYFGGAGFEDRYATIFRVLNLTLALPVFFYSAGEFFGNAWKGIKPYLTGKKGGSLNIDAPIALALLITFSRSLYEIISGTGAGYLDSMSGIVFFMLVGRTVQERTFSNLSFHRDYTSYFPIAVTVAGPNGSHSKSLHDLIAGDEVHLHNEEIIPADSTLMSREARIDYSFVTGESEAVKKTAGDKIYAGGRLIGEQAAIKLLQPVAGSYLTSLWNHKAFSKNEEDGSTQHSLNALSRYFTIVLFTLAAATALFWAFQDASKILNAVTAMLIVACPCALLLSATFTNGNLLRLFSNAGLYLRDAAVIATLGKIDFIAFDKTGTLTSGSEVKSCGAYELTDYERSALHTAVRSSRHPYSRALAEYCRDASLLSVTNWREEPGKGIRANVDGQNILVGNKSFTGSDTNEGNVFVRIGGRSFAFTIAPQFRKGLGGVVDKLRKRFGIALLSGDNTRQKPQLEKIFGDGAALHFHQQPLDKLSYIADKQANGNSVLMIGDGLNDAGALQQSDAGISLAEDVNNFTPACDAILDAKQFHQLPGLLKLAKTGRIIIGFSFFISILYNLIGLSIAMQGHMNPMIAAILMPASTISIVLLSTGLSSLAAWNLFRNKNHRPA